MSRELEALNLRMKSGAIDPSIKDYKIWELMTDLEKATHQYGVETIALFIERESVEIVLLKMRDFIMETLREKEEKEKT